MVDGLARVGRVVAHEVAQAECGRLARLVKRRRELLLNEGHAAARTHRLLHALVAVGEVDESHHGIEGELGGVHRCVKRLGDGAAPRRRGGGGGGGDDTRRDAPRPATRAGAHAGADGGRAAVGGEETEEDADGVLGAVEMLVGRVVPRHVREEEACGADELRRTFGPQETVHRRGGVGRSERVLRVAVCVGHVDE